MVVLARTRPNATKIVFVRILKPILQGKEFRATEVNEFGLTVIDGTLPIRTQQRQVRDIVSPYLKEKLKEKVAPGRLRR